MKSLRKKTGMLPPSDAFRDIVQGRAFSYPPHAQGVAGAFTPTGTNRSSTANGYNTSAGYDLCTGWGSPNGVALVAQLGAWLKANPPAAWMIESE